MTGSAIPDTTIRLVVADVDGTLVGQDRQISARVRQAVRDAQQHGVQFALCTGRPMFATRPYIDELQLDGFHIVDAGATILNPSTGDVLYQYEYSVPTARAVLAYMRREHLYLEVYSGDDYYVEAPSAHNRLHAEVMRYDPIIRNLDDVIGHLPITKMETVVVDDPERARLRVMAAQFTDQIALAWSLAPGSDADFVNIMPVGISKGTAVNRLIEHVGIPVSQVMGIGDARNDEPLLRAVGLPVAMGDAPDSLKQIARWVTQPVEADGLALAVERFILSNGHGAPTAR